MSNPEMLKSFLDNFPGAAYLLNPHNWTMVYVSQGCYSLTGYHPEMLVNNKSVCFLDIIHEEDRSCIQEQIRLAADDKKPFDLSYRIVTQNGQVKCVWDHGQAIYAENGRLAYIEGFITEITSRFSFKNCLSKKHVHLKHYQSPTLIGTWEVDLTTGTEEWSDEIFRIIGICRDKISKDCSLKIDQYVHPVDKPKIEAIFNNFQTDQSKAVFECRIIRPDQNVRHILAEGEIVVDPTGKPIKLIGIVQDISDRKKKEEELIKTIAELKHTQEALQVSEEKFYKIFEYSPDSLQISRPDDGIILDVNRTFMNLTGYSHREVVGKSSKELNLWVHTDHYQQYLDTLKVKGECLERETVFRTKDGRFVPVIISGTIVDIGGQPVILTIVRDIRQQKQMELEIIKAKEAAEAANRAKSEFLATMSHEIRTPMNAILGFSEILLQTAEDTKQKSYLSNIYSSGKVMLSIINDILDLSKIEAGKLEIQPDLVNIKDLLTEIEMIFDQKIREKGLHFILDISPEVPDGLMLDEIRIRQILINLIGNAIKFTIQGYIKVSVQCTNIDLTSNTVTVIFEVEDTGIGISKDQIRSIFETYYQQKGQKVKQYGGSGLGLSITKKLVELMNGNISVSSEIGKGSKFQVQIHHVQLVDIAYEDISLSSEIKECIFHPATMLVVDDSDSTRSVIKAFMENTNVKVIEAENVNQMVSLLETDLSIPPNVILLDIILPDKDGYEALKIIRNNPKFQHVPIIAFTACVMKDEEERIRSVFNGYLPKPITRSELIGELQKFLPYTELLTYSESDNICKSESKIDIPDKVKARLPELIAILKSRYFPLLQEIQDGFFIDDIEAFGKDLQQLAEAYEFDFLHQYSSQLLEYIRANQIDEIEQMIKHFSSIIEQIQS